MAFVGNTKHNVPYMLKHSHLFESIPDGYIKGAFLDRMHMYIPGWEVRILKSRRCSPMSTVSSWTTWLSFCVSCANRTIRRFLMARSSLIASNRLSMVTSVVRIETFSGMAKILFPHLEMTDTKLRELLDFCMEGQSRQGSAVHHRRNVQGRTCRLQLHHPCHWRSAILPRLLETKLCRCSLGPPQPSRWRAGVPCQRAMSSRSQPATAPNHPQGQPNRRVLSRIVC